MQLEENRESLLISNMSYADVQGALKNGGVYRGVQLDQARLGQRGAQLIETMDVTAAMTSGASAAKYTKDVWNQVADFQTGLIARDKELNGGRLSPVMRQYLVNERARIERYNTGMQALDGNPIAQQRYAANGLKEAQDAFTKAEESIDALAKGQTRNPDAQLAIKSYYTGVSMTQEQSVKAISAFIAEGGMPPGLRMEGAAGAAMTAASAAVTQLEQTEAFKSSTKDEQMRLRNRTVSAAVGAQFNGFHSRQVMKATPRLAREAKHPFGGMLTDDQFEAGIEAGDNIAYARAGAKLGLSPEETKLLFGSAARQEAYNAPRKVEARVNFEAMGKQLLADQQVAVIQQWESMRPGAGRAFADFVRSDGYQSRIGLYADNAGRGDFGSALAASAGGNSLRDRLASNMQGMAGAAGTAIRQQHVEKAAVYQGYGNDPFVRAGAVIAANPELTPQEEKILLTAVRKMVGDAPNRGMSATDYIAQEESGNEATFLAVSSLIKNNKFQDAGLERIRKIAAKTWDQDLGAADRVMRGVRGE
jgi:hypothetical protein